jgi:Na+/melibiose symporter-like transporter
LLAAQTFISISMVPMIYSSISSMFADIVDEHELDVGERREGIVFAASSFSRKVTSAVGVLIGGAILDFIHFPKGAVAGTVAPETLWSMGLLSGPASGALVLVGVTMYMGYRLDRQRHGVIVRQLQERRDAAALAAGG